MEKSKEFLEQERIYKEIERMESEIKALKFSIDTIGNGREYFSVFQLNKDDYIALIEVRKRKISKLSQ